MSDDEKHPDVLLLAEPTEDGGGVRVVRAREGGIEAGELRPLAEGKPLVAGEIVKLKPRPESPRVCDVEVVAKVGAGAAEKGARVGPAQVATRAYRESWERTFGATRAPAGLPN